MVKSDKSRRIGIFGGTFNPIHHGHLINIQLVKEEFALDLVLLIPAKIPVHKTVTDGIDPADRYRMTELAVTGLDGFHVSDIEIKRESASYTITTLEELERIYPDDELLLIIGSDSFNELDTWKEYKKIITNYTLIVMQRPGNMELREDLLSASYDVHLHVASAIEISSSGIRERIRKGLPVKFFTADNVIDFINGKGLYKIEH